MQILFLSRSILSFPLILVVDSHLILWRVSSTKCNRSINTKSIRI